MKFGESTKISRLDRIHLEYVQIRHELSEKLIEVKKLRDRLQYLDKQLNKKS